MAETKDQQRDTPFLTVKLILVLVVLSVIVIVTLWNPQMITLADYTVGNYVELFTPFILVALLIERGLEVLLTVWRGPMTTVLEQKLLRLQGHGGEKKREKRPDDGSTQEELSTVQKQLNEYKAVTQRSSFTLSVLIGIIVSLLGMRVLEMLFDADAISVLPDYQQSMLRITDVLITGFLLGGGADGIHKVLSLFTTYMDETKKKVKEANQK